MSNWYLLENIPIGNKREKVQLVKIQLVKIQLVKKQLENLISYWFQLVCANCQWQKYPIGSD